jgi:hypothetical protein
MYANRRLLVGAPLTINVLIVIAKALLFRLLNTKILIEPVLI